MIAPPPLFKLLNDGRYVRYDSVSGNYEVVPRENAPPLRVLQLSEASGKHSFGCATLSLRGPIADKLLALGQSIREEDLGEDGRETEPHVTIRYGLHTEDVGEVLKILATSGPIPLKLGKVSVFAGAETGKPFDVLKADVESPQLVALHGKLGALPHTDTHPVYKPHATIAYVKAGLGAKYAARMGDLNATDTITEATYSNAEKQKGTCKLSGHDHLASVLAMIKFQQKANAAGDPEASQPYIDEIRGRLKSLRMSWRQEQSAAGHIKAVGEGEHQGRTLYGRDAEAALRNQAKGPKVEEPSLFESPKAPAPPPVEKIQAKPPATRGRPTKAAKSAAEAAKAEAAKARAEDLFTNLFAGLQTSEDLDELGGHLPWLEDGALASAAAQVSDAGAKEDDANKLMNDVRAKLDAADAAAAAPPAEPKSDQPEMSKEQAKEIMKGITLPDKLPEGHEMYFNVEKADATLPLSKIKNLRARPEGVENAGKFMEGARQGKLPKRDPIKVVNNGDDTFTVADGNSTYANAVKSEWSSMPVKFVDRAFLDAENAKTREKESRKASSTLASEKLFQPEEQELPKDVRHPHRTPERLMAAAERAKPVFDLLLDTGKGVDKALGGTSVHAGSKEEFLSALDRQGPVVVVGGLKGLKRAKEKVDADYKGDWTRLGDVVRGTVGVDSTADIPGAIQAIREELDKHGWRIAKQPKNKFATPTDEGYRDINLTFQTDEGLTGEIQVNTKPMLKAKEAAHALYEQQRTIQANAKKEDRDLTPAELEQYNELVGQQKHLYDTAWHVSLGTAHESELSSLLRHAGHSGPEAGGKQAPGKDAAGRDVADVQRPGADGNAGPSGSGTGVSGAGQSLSVPHVAGEVTSIDAVGFDKPIPARFAVVDLSDLKPSHSYSTGSPSARADYPAHLQPRNYAAGSAEDVKVRDMAQRMQVRYHLADTPDASNGAPTVTGDGTVLNGNARTMSLELAKRNGRFAEYRRALEKKAQGYGIDAAHLKGMAYPVLVRVVDMDPHGAEAKKFASSGNVSQTQAQTPIRSAASIARVIDSDLLDSLRLNDDTTFSEAVSHPVTGRAFRDHLFNLLPSQEHSRYFTPDGNLTEGGTELVRSMLLSKVLPVELVERLGETHKALKKTIEGSIPQLLKVRRDHPHADLSPQLVEALNFKADNPLATTPGSVDNILSQGSLLGGKAAPLSPAGRMLVDFLNENGEKPRVTRQKLSQFVGDLSAKGGLYGEHMPDTPTLAAEALGVQERPGAVFGPDGKPPVPDENLPVSDGEAAPADESGVPADVAGAGDAVPADSSVKPDTVVSTSKTSSGQEVRFVPHHSQSQGGRQTIEVDVKSLDAAWAADDPDRYIPAGGGGAEIGGRRDGFTRFMGENKPIQAAQVVLDADGKLSIDDGRHRTSVLRDAGVDKIAITVPDGQAEKIREKLGGGSKPEEPSKAPHEMTRDEFVNADPEVKKRRQIHDETLKNQPHNAGVSAEHLAKAEKAATDMHAVHVATAPKKEERSVFGEHHADGPIHHEGRPLLHGDLLVHKDRHGESLIDVAHAGRNDRGGVTITPSGATRLAGFRPAPNESDLSNTRRATAEDVKRLAEQDGATKVPSHYTDADRLAKMPVSEPNAPVEVPHANQLESPGGTGESGGVHGGLVGGDAPAVDRAGQPGAGEGVGGGLPALPDREDASGAESEPAAAGRRRNAASGGAKAGAARTPRKRRQSGGPPRDDAGVRLGGGVEGNEPALPNPTPAEQVVSEPPTPENPTDLSAGNFRYNDHEFFSSGLKSKFNANMAAIRTLREIQAEGRTTATPEEQAILSKFVGWGQFPGVFNDFRDGDFQGEDDEDWKSQLAAQGMDHDKWQEERGKWAKEREALHAVLSPEEWDAAKKSTLNAHYTHPAVVDAHWKIAQKLGFKGGKYLETSAGIGYYLGLMPPELAGKTHTAAVELDPTPGAMLKMLYPKADVHIEGFEKHRTPDNFYDMIASNVPFGRYSLHEEKYNKFQAKIHDHFFLKSADKVRPGGIIQHITSTGTLDKPDSRIREELAKTCDLVAAIRFPGGAHKANAGTDVVTDMVILRKRLPGEEPGDQSWLQTTTVPDPAGGAPITVNKYFADNPGQILGTLDRTGTMYRKDSVNVSMTPDYEERLQAAIERIPANVMSSNRAPKRRFEPETLPAPGEVKVGGYHIQDGKLFVREGDGIVEQQVGHAERGKIEAHLGVRDAMRAVINAETAGDDAEPARAELNKVYDAFVKKHGALNNPKNRRAFGDDPDSPPLLALEKYDPKTKEATKADIFRKIVVGAIKSPEKADNVAEGLGISLHEHGGLDISRIAELTGKHPDAVGAELVEQGLAFHDPSDGWQPADHYLSGNVRRKLANARAAAAVDPKYAANVAALEKVQPEDIHHEEIDARLGSPWIPTTDIHQFAVKALGANANGIEVRYEPSRSEWTASYASNYAGQSASRSKAAKEIWATSRADFMTLLNSALNGKMPNFQTRIPGSEPPQYTADKEENEAVAAKIQELKDEFKNWVWTDDERRERLHRHYNDNFNNIRLLKYNGQHQKLPGMNPAFRDNMHPHIKDFIWQVVTTGKGLAAHEVGTGKTTAMVASAMELRRLGLARKPALLCKKANVDAVTKDALELYPGARILSTADMFTAEKRKLAASRIATGDYDMIIMTHDHMDALPMRPETMQKFIREELAEVTAAHAAAYAANPDKNDRIVKNLEDQKAKVEVRLNEALNEKAKDDAVYFEDLGIDHLFVDEAQRYKSLPVYTKMSQLKGVPTGQSQRATSMYMRTQWLAEKNKGRGTVFLTGTPISNTIPELFTMQRFLQPEELRERGLNVFDAWAATFADIRTTLERKATGKHEPTTRLAEFTNMPELMQMSRQMMDVVRADDLLREPKPGEAEEVPEEAKPKLENYTGATYDKDDNKFAWKNGKLMSYIVKRPKKNKVLNRAPNTEGVQRLMASLAERAESLKGQKPGPGEDNYLVITTDGRMGSLDPRLLDKDAPDDPDSKVNHLVNNVLDIHNDNPGKTQMIFSDSRESKHNPGFSVFTDIIEKLVKKGVSRDKIVDFTNLSERQREQAIQGLRDGSISVALGGTDTLGTGVNAQEHLLALHHLDCPWRPADLEQREGRAYRHGNKNKKIHIHNYVTEGSFDEMLWQGIDRKSRFIRAILDTDPATMKRSYKEEDTEELSYEQIMAAASGDPRILERVQLHDDIAKLHNAKKRHTREQDNFKYSLQQADKKAADLKGAIDDYRATANHLAGQPNFHLRVGNAQFAERGGSLDKFLTSQGMARKDFDKLPDEQKKPLMERFEQQKHVWDPNAALEKAQRESNNYSPIGHFRGLPLHHSGGWTSLRTLGGRTINTGTSLKAIENQAARMAEHADEHERMLTQHHKDIAAIREKAGKPFSKEEDLKRKQERLKQLEAEMAAPEEMKMPKHLTVGGNATVMDRDFREHTVKVLRVSRPGYAIVESHGTGAEHEVPFALLGLSTQDPTPTGRRRTIQI